MPTVGNALLTLRNEYQSAFIATTQQLDRTETIFQSAYESQVLGEMYDKRKKLEQDIRSGQTIRLEDKQELANLRDELSREEVKSVTKMLTHRFDVTFGTLGLDVIPLQLEALDPEQKKWVYDRLNSLKKNLLEAHQRMVVFTLKKQGLLQAVDESFFAQDDQSIYARYI
jgi:hypothetical protein